MLKISKSIFLSSILHDTPELISNGEVAEIPAEQILEHKIRGKYFYELTKESPYRRPQQLIQELILSNIETSDSAIAYKKGLSYLNFLEPHKSSYFFLRLDVRSFFHSISHEVIRDSFSAYFSDELLDDRNNQTLLDVFLKLVTLRIPEHALNHSARGHTLLPIGFLTSPTISNIVFRKLDLLIQRYCLTRNILYTRYADDLLFSSDKSNRFIHSETFEKEIRILLSQLDLKLNKKKTMKKENTISLNGYVIEYSSRNSALPIPIANGKRSIRISNKKLKVIKKLLHLWFKEKDSSLQIMSKLYNYRLKSKFSDDPIPPHLVQKYATHQFTNKVAGYRSYLISILNFDKRYHCVDVASKTKYRELIIQLNRILDSIS